MSAPSAKDLFNEVHKTLSDPEVLKALSVDRTLVKELFEDTSFARMLEHMVENKDYRCSTVLSLCKSALNKLAGNNAPKNWLQYIYRFTLSRSFPHTVDIPLLPELDSACTLYLKILKLVCQYEKFHGTPDNWQSKYPLEFLSPRELQNLEDDEYRAFVKAFENEYIYEMMKLNKEVMGYNTLDHICGVHYMALFIARQLLDAGLPVDLGRISGAAAGHDIGKYGCKGEELKRVPYLHYYYTDQWFKNHDIVYIRHIALNHSTWDLELENLSLESLILIYSDFRIKKKGPHMHVFTLDEAFDVVLNKLDNLDQAKEKRYRRVFSKLKDFEDFLVHMGINVDIDSPKNEKALPGNRGNHYPLMQGKEIVDNLKYFSINHNIRLMHQLRNEASLNSLLELARSEDNWHHLREYLRIFEEYSTYLTQKQKLITLNFLYEQLIHPEEDIRRHSAELIGALIALFDEKHRKEVPPDASIDPPDITSSELLDKYLVLFTTPDHKMIPAHRVWIRHSMSIMISSLFTHCKSDKVDPFIGVLSNYYKKKSFEEKDTQLYLLRSAKYIPVWRKEKSLEAMFDFILQALEEEDPAIRLAALETTYNLLPFLHTHCTLVKGVKKMFQESITYSDIPAENFLKLRISGLLNLDRTTIETYSNFSQRDKEKIADIFLSNLKTATHWVKKKIQVDLLLEHTLKNDIENVLHTAMHFCNLIKVSAAENVRNRAGEALVQIIPHLSPDQRNDVTIELLRALEIEGYQFSKYIPYYLGQLMLYLPPVELDELIDDLIEKVKQSRPQVVSLLLKTVGIALSNYPKYKARFKEADRLYNERLKKLLGILLNGMVNYNLQIRQVAFSVIGKDIFGSKFLTLEQKNQVFQLIAKKILTMIAYAEEKKRLPFLSNTAGLNHIYRFISDYMFFKEDINICISRKVAFFPGTFDPFTLSHKEITKEIRDLGFEVYLAVDEFSWSKRTQPNLIRRNIINMSIADELGIYIYPGDIPINIANPADLKTLRESFPHSDVYMVVGSDVIMHASGYLQDKEECSVHTFPHIIFERKSLLSSEEDDNKLDDAISRIDGEVIRLSLPPQYEDISSTLIRDYVDQNRDISRLVDPLAQKYIYEYSLYRREPQYKTMMQTRSISVEVLREFSPELLDRLSSEIFKNKRQVLEHLRELSNKLNPRILIIREANRRGKLMGFSVFHGVRSSMLFQEFKDNMISEYIRDNAVGRILVINGIFAKKDTRFPNLEQIILTETLSYCLERDYSYAVFKNAVDSYSSPDLHDTLRLQGFFQIPYSGSINPVFAVNMNAPCTLNLDVDTIIKEPFRSSPDINQTIIRSRKRLQKALTMLYPGRLVLSFDRNVMHEKLIMKICSENGVPTTPSEPRMLGPAMCVPYGNILNKSVVPNTVTKSLHTEKMFAPDMKDFRIGPFPYYLDLEVQVRMLRSFGRPIILVDDLLNKGYRIKALDPLFKREGINIEKIIVGILSGRGKELMDIQDREVDCAYFIPKLKAWFNEKAMYPFIGGDSLWRGIYPRRNLLPSVNLILPYTSPTFINDASNAALYNLSQTCIQNALDILTALETEYQNINERALTLGLLGEVIIHPRCPDHGKNMDYDLSLKPSHYLKNDLELLKRLELSIIKDDRKHL